MCRIIDEVLYIVHRIRQEVEGWNGRECKGRKNKKRRLGWVDVTILAFWQGRGMGMKGMG